MAQKLDSGAGMYEVHITDTENPQVHFAVFQSFVVLIYKLTTTSNVKGNP